MKKFITKTLTFSVLIAGILGVTLVFISNPTVQRNMMGALLDKHQLLTTAPSPKIILIGGSNLTFGLDSKKIQEQFGLPVVNAGLHASLGMKYYLNDIKPFIKKGDIVLLAPEYSQFYTKSFYGNIELVSVLFDVYSPGRTYIDLYQWMHLAEFIPVYAATKLKFWRKLPSLSNPSVYDRKAFNAFGDVSLHWTLPRKHVETAKPLTGEEGLLDEAITAIQDFKRFTESQSATFVMSPPVYQQSSYDNQAPIIRRIFEEIGKSDIPIIARPEKYRFPDSLFFDTNSHLIKKGVDLRTAMLIDDLRAVVKDNPL